MHTPVQQNTYAVVVDHGQLRHIWNVFHDLVHPSTATDEIVPARRVTRRQSVPQNAPFALCKQRWSLVAWTVVTHCSAWSTTTTAILLTQNLGVRVYANGDVDRTWHEAQCLPHSVCMSKVEPVETAVEP